MQPKPNLHDSLFLTLEISKNKIIAEKFEK